MLFASSGAPAVSAESPRARATDDACPASRVPEDGFRDVPRDHTHETAIDCAVWWDLVRGDRGGSYGPDAAVTRGQVATVLDRLLRATHRPAPAGPDAFTDDDGSAHEPAIDRLAHAGIVAGRDARRFEPQRPVRRDQFAAMLVETFAHRAHNAHLSASGTYFADDDDSVHEAAVDAIAEVGVTTGDNRGRFRPGAPVTRGQLATFATRFLDVLVERGYTNLPDVSCDGAPPVSIARVVADPDGDDLERGAGEFVEIALAPRWCADVRLDGWFLEDADGHRILLPDGFLVELGTSVRVYSSDGPGGRDRHHAGRPAPVWDNGGDDVVLYDGRGSVVDRYRY